MIVKNKNVKIDVTMPCEAQLRGFVLSENVIMKVS